MPRIKIKTPLSVSIDRYIKELKDSFREIPYFDVVQQSEIWTEVFNLLTSKLIDILNLKTLYKDYYCPAIIACIKRQKKQIKKSRYFAMSKEIEEELQEMYFSTMRNGYVQLFHLIESYVERILFDRINQICAQDDYAPIETYCFENYNFKIRCHWKRIDERVEKINWICNRVKHDDGYPKDDLGSLPIHYLVQPSFDGFDTSRRMRVEIDEFVQDVDCAKDFIVQITFIITILYTLQACNELIPVFEKASTDVNIRPHAELFINSYQGLSDHMSNIINLWKTIGIDENRKSKMK